VDINKVSESIRENRKTSAKESIIYYGWVENIIFWWSAFKIIRSKKAR